MSTEFQDDALETFAAQGATPLPLADKTGYVEREGARIWFGAYGEGPPVVLLHGGLGHSGNWGYQIPALTEAGYQVFLVDSRGHGRSTRDGRPYSYVLMSDDLLSVMDHLGLHTSALIGWSDGACVALILADRSPDRVERVFYFACNMDPSGTKPMEESAALGRCFSRHVKDYQALSATPGNFQDFMAAVTQMMESQPNYTAQDLSKIGVPVTVAIGENDEFIRREHAEYLANTLPHADLRILPGVSHFAPLQRPAEFNLELLQFLRS